MIAVLGKSSNNCLLLDILVIKSKLISKFYRHFVNELNIKQQVLDFKIFKHNYA
ncbi:hypothetical protein GAPWK_2061 [Gilliamella apicola]|nr:hypothetical protein GAPWK_2061 [Gilliamella apicola]